VLWEASHSEAGTGRSPLWSTRAQRPFLGTAVYRVSRWLTLVSEFPSWTQFGLLITGILRIPVILVTIYPSYSSGRIRSKAVRGWLIVPALNTHLGQVTGAPGTASAMPHLSHARVPGTVKGCLSANLIAQRLRLDKNSWDCKAVQGGRAAVPPCPASVPSRSQTDILFKRYCQTHWYTNFTQNVQTFFSMCWDMCLSLCHKKGYLKQGFRTVWNKPFNILIRVTIQNNAEWPKAPPTGSASWFWGTIPSCTGGNPDPQISHPMWIAFLVCIISGTITSFMNTHGLIYPFLKLCLSVNKQTIPSSPKPGSECRIIPDKDKCAISFVIIPVNPIFLCEEKFHLIPLMCIVLSLKC